MSHTSQLISNLQVLRAVAAAMVVLHHLRDGFRGIFPVAGDYVVGAAGVDIFFILSGVVITLAEQRRACEPVAFMTRRIERVVPMYWMALALMGIMLSIGLFPSGVQPVDATFGNMLRSLFFVPFERAHGAVMPLVGVGWTLNYEMFFYLVFAVLMILPAHLRSFGVIAVMLTLAGTGYVLRPVGTFGVFYTNPILLEFAAGVALAHLWSRSGTRSPWDRPLGTALLLAGLVLFALNARQEGLEELRLDRVVIFGLPALGCVAGAMLLERGGVRLQNPFILRLGAASYALYLFHPFVLQGFDVLGRTLGVDRDHAGLVTVLAVAAFVCAHAVAIAIHFYLERPVIAWLREARRSVQTAAAREHW